MASGGASGFGQGSTCNPKAIEYPQDERTMMQSFHIPINLISTYGVVNENKMKKITTELQNELESLHKHAVACNQVQCLYVWKGVSLGKNCLLMNIELNNRKDLDDLYECSKEDNTIKLNRLSQIVTDYFRQREMGVVCELSSKEELNFDIVLKSNVYDRVLKKLETPESRLLQQQQGPTCSSEVTKRITDDNIQPQHENKFITRTFICHIPKVSQGYVTKVNIIGDRPQDFKLPMYSLPNNMYTIRLELSANYEQFNYLYEVERYFPDKYLFKKRYKNYEGYTMHTNSSNVIRDVVTIPQGTMIEGISAHLYDVIVHNQDGFSYADLVSWVNQFCLRISQKEATECAKSLVSTGVQSEESIIRLILMIYQLDITHSINMQGIVHPSLAKQFTEHFRHKKLTDFPLEKQSFMSEVCKCVYYLSDPSRSCIVDFIDKFWSFFEKKDLLELLKGELMRGERFIYPEGETQLVERGKELILMIVEKKDDTTTEVLNIFMQHCPSELVVEIVDELRKQSSAHQDLLLDLNEYLRLHFLEKMKKAKQNNRLMELFRIAAIAFGPEDKFCVMEEFENTLVHLFSCDQDISVDNLLKATRDCLRNTLCFDSVGGREKLVKAILDSKSNIVWSMFPMLIDEEKLFDTFKHLDKIFFKTWFDKELKVKSSHANVENIASKVFDISPVLKSNVVKQRGDVLTALNETFAQWISKFHKKDVIKSIPKVDELVENDPDTRSFYKAAVHQFLCQFGRRPVEVLLPFCKYKDQLIVDDRTTAEVLASIIDVFFAKETDLKRSLSDVFIFLTKHVKFWDLLKKSTGTYLVVIQENETYQCIENALDKFAKYFLLHDLSLKTFDLIQQNVLNSNTLLQLSGVTSSSFDKILQSYDYFMDNSQKMLMVSRDTAKIVQVRKIPNHETIMNCIISFVKEMEETIRLGNVTLHELVSVNPQWADFKVVSDVCTNLHPLVQSEVFWKLSFNDVLEIYVGNKCPLITERSLLCMRLLFDDYSNDSEFEQYEGLYSDVDFLMVLNNTGRQHYSDFWKRMDANMDVKMADITNVFKKSTIPKELQLSYEILGRSKSAKVNDALMKIWETKNIIPATDAIESVLGVLDYDVEDFVSLKEDIDSFRELTFQNVDDYSIRKIHSMLTNIFALTKSLSSLTIEIMNGIGESSQLIEFLKGIAIGDIRNLIDAVEDISESHVQESTVSALIHIKRFLDPLLNPQMETINARWVFKTLETQTSSMKDKAKELPGKLRDCRDNLHNLKSLYNGVANRGQQTKEIIKSIVMKGEFSFTFCSEKEVFTYSAQYRDNKIKYEKNETVLLDMRSRALLLLNSDRQSTESSFNTDEFRSFIQAIDLCIEISDTLLQLFSTGCILYTHFKEKLSVKVLPEKKEFLTHKLICWNVRMKSIREKYYLMNFITGSQIHAFSSFFETGGSEPEVLAILKFIHPQLSIESLSNAHYHSKFTDQIERISEALHKAHRDLCFFYRDMDCTDCKRKKMTDCVQEGRIHVSQLEENSKYVIKTVFALYHNTTHHFPEPNQVMFCSSDTHWQELELLLNRCQSASTYYGVVPLYCLANVEKLQNEVQFKLVDKLQTFKTGSNIMLAIVCRGSKNHPFVDRLSRNISVVQPMTDVAFRILLQRKFHLVQLYTSEVAGLGKTSKIITDGSKKDLSPKTIHISGTLQTKSIVDSLVRMKFRRFHFLHIDIGMVDDLDGLDVFLFELIVLKYCSAGKSVFYLSTENVSLEIANSILNTLSNSLHIATSFKRFNLTWNNFDDYKCSMEMDSPSQVVCRYLKAIDEGQIDLIDIHNTKGSHFNPLSTLKCRELLRKHMAATSDISYAIVNVFLNVLADQLKKFSCSSFFKVSRIADMIENNVVPTIRSNLVKSIIEVSRDFATRSVNACRTEQDTTVSYAEFVEASTKDIAESAVNRTSGMIRWEESNHLLYVFHNQNIQTLSAMYREKDKLPEHIYKMFETQMNKPLPNFSKMTQAELREVLIRVASQKKTINKQQLTEMSKDYAITPDNLLKMVLIMMRVLSRVPVVVMGETGCGKTSLIRYLALVCEVPFEVLNIHAGTNPTDVVQVIKKCNERCRENLDKQHWLFLDEINTSETIGLICSFICHRKCGDIELMPNLIVMGACNPYKMRSAEAIKTAGLTGKIKSDDLSKLIYRVLPLPEMMIDYVWDFGSLSEKDEQLYIERMLEDVFRNKPHLNTLLCKMLSVSQRFVREKEASTCVVSLRDVHRCKTLVVWFDDILGKKVSKTKVNVDKSVRAIILALAHCYHSRFIDKQARMKYLEALSETAVYLSAEFIHNIIKEEQTDILDRMELPPGIAKNSALKENVFVILVCILNRMPVFLVGKPGCSKSLALQVIRSNLRGKDSKNDFFKSLPQLYCVSFQGSESSTSDGIKKVFEKAENYQNSNSKDDVLSVVLLDEIGLAEVSRFNPLKVLHSLLEPEGRSRPNIAVVGISNWALDASKMNRAIHLSRPDMDEDELVETAISITRSFNETVKKEPKGLSMASDIIQGSIHNIDEDLRLIAQSYISYTRGLQHKHFHGLRDFYSLVKFVARKIAQISEYELTTQIKTDIILEGLQRNFGGLSHGQAVIIEHFKRCLMGEEYAFKPCPVLICENINDVLARHLMVITKGESVMDMIERNISTLDKERTEIIYGSQFEEDLTDDYSYRILSKIILCMEQGIVLILKDLDYIYGSLYDMLNQNYTRIGNKNNCRVALGPYSNPFCHVDESFRCIVIVEENNLDYSDPPFLNRFEKQHLTYSDTLNNDQKLLLKELFDWVRCLTVVDGKFDEFTAFPYFNNELLVSLVLYHEQFSKSKTKSVLDRCKHNLLWLLRPEVIFRLEMVTDQEIVHSRFDLEDEYFALPIHNGIGHFIEYQSEQTESSPSNRITIIFTSSNIHTDISHELTQWTYISLKLGAFKSEKRLSTTLKQFWEDHEQDIMLLHCNAAEDGKHLMLAKSLIDKFAGQYNGKNNQHMKSVYIIVHMNIRLLSTTSEYNTDSQSFGSIAQINFLSGCQLVLLDSLEKPKQPLTLLCKTTLLEMAELFVQNADNIRNALFWSFTRIKYDETGRSAESVKAMMVKMKESAQFLDVLAGIILHHLKHTLSRSNDENVMWFLVVACDSQALVTCSSFVSALETHIKSTVVMRMAKFIFGMERIGLLDSFFVNDADVQGRRSLWINLLSEEKLICIDKIPNPTGPECYFCNWSDLSLRMPFSCVIFDAIEKTKDVFVDCVTRAKVKCDIEPDGELPNEVLTEIMYHHEAFVEPVIPVDISKDILVMYPSLCDDYIIDFCNIFSNRLSSHLNCEWRTLFTKWLIEQKKELLGEELYRIASHLHCIGWIHYSSICPALQLLELYFVFIEKFPLQADKLSHKARKSCPISDLTDEDNNSGDELKLENRNDDTDDNEFRTDEDDGVKYKNTVAEYSSDEFSTYTKSAVFKLEDITSLETVECFVSTISLQMLRKCADNSTRYLTKMFITIAREVSEDTVLEKLRLCDDIATYLIDIHGLNMDVLKPLVGLLENADVESDAVFTEIKRILNFIDHQQSNTSKSWTLRQYLFRCMLSNDESKAYLFLFQAITENIIPEQEYGLLKGVLFIFMETLDMRVIDMISLYGSVQQSYESSYFLTQLNEVLSEFKHRNKPDHHFTMIVVDVIEELINLSEDDNFSDLIYKAGIIMQKGSFTLDFVTAVAFLRFTISEIGDRMTENIHEHNPELVALNGVITGLHESSICHSLKLYFLKILGQTSALHWILKNSNSLSEVFPCIAELQWSQQFWCKAEEYNTMAMYVNKRVLRKGEMLICQTEGFENNLNELKSVIQASGEQGKLLVYSLAMSEYFTRIYHSGLDDDRKKQADKFLEIVVDSLQSKYEKKMLCFLTRREDFPDECFQIHEVTSFQQYLISSSLVSFYCLILSKMNECHLQRSLLLKCLLRPSEIVSLHEPSGYPHMDQFEDCKKMHFVVCKCNNRLLLKHEMSICPICGNVHTLKTKTDSCSQSDINKCHDKDYVSSLRHDYFVGHMSALSFHIYHFLIKGALLGSLQLDTSNTQPVEKLLSVSEIDLYKHLYSGIENHWINIGCLTNLSDYEVAHLMRRLFRVSINSLFEDVFQFENADAILKWEQSFDSRVSILVRDNICNIHQHQRHYEDVYELPKQQLESQVRELDCIKEYTESERCNLLPSLFRLTRKPTKANFVQLLISNKQKHPWLMKVMLLEEVLQLPKHICNIMHWHNLTSMKLSYSFNRWECTDMSIREFIDKQDSNSRAQKMFQAFRSSVTLLKNKLDDNVCSDIPDLTENTKLYDCLMFDKDSWLYMLITKLATIQNNFIDCCLMMSFDCQNLQFLLKDENTSYFRSVSVNELKQDNLISLKMDEANFDYLLKVNSCTDLVYGRGHVINYDFHNIEKELVYDLLCDGQRCYITLSGIQFIVFKDELYRSFVELLNVVKHQVPQEPLPVDLMKQVERTNSDSPNMALSFINYLDMILTLLKRTKCQPDTPLNEYVQTFKHMIGHDFSMNFLSSLESKLKVCHIVSLHELLEEISVDRIIGCLEEKYRKGLSENLQQHFRSLTSENIPRAETINKALKRFIYRCIYMCRTCPDGLLHLFIVDPSFWAEPSPIEGTLQINGKTEQLLQIFPPEVRICQVVCIVEQLVESIEAQREVDVQVNSVITTWKQTRQVKPSQGQKIVKRLKKM